jgi:hypothetical protein
MEIINVIIAIFIITSVLSIGVMSYEWIRYHSGLFKPVHPEDVIEEKVKFYESCLKYNNGGTQDDQDYYDYWFDQLKTMKRYKKIHRIS